MGEVKVTKEHRARALDALYLSRWKSVPHLVEWAASGRYAPSAIVATLPRVASLDAAAESRVRAAVIADLSRLLERSEFIGPVDYVQADSIRNLIETLEAQQS